MPSCGDGTCNGNENCSTCNVDCGNCPTVCENGFCEIGETCEGCWQDCPTIDWRCYYSPFTCMCRKLNICDPKYKQHYTELNCSTVMACCFLGTTGATEGVCSCYEFAPSEFPDPLQFCNNYKSEFPNDIEVDSCPNQ